MRFRARLDVREPLKKEKKIKKPRGEVLMEKFRYERLPNFCFICGCVGHIVRHCEIYFRLPDDKIIRQWDITLRAPLLKSSSLGGEKWLIEEVVADTSENLPLQEVDLNVRKMLPGLKVRDLLIPGWYWVRDLVRGLFEQGDAEEILNIPLGIGGDLDKLIWHFESKGNYSVRSAYRILMEKISLRPSLVVEGNWEQHVVDGTRSTAATVLWSLWRERNRRVWTNEACMVWTAMKLALDDLANWKAAQVGPQPINRNTAPQCNKWHAPPPDTLKCNTDIGFRDEENKMGLGIILQDCEGRVWGYRQWHGIGRWTTREGEAVAFLTTLRWVSEDGHDDLIFELDAESVRNALNDSVIDDSKFGCIIQQCRDFLLRFPRFRVQVVRRNRNQAAHLLAR
ncbi:hypothetical protein LINPERHAP2_LOCUS25784 [Linum perenne]